MRLVYMLVVICFAAASSAQFVSGEWVDRGEANIRRFRMAAVKFLVLDTDGRLASGATVKVEQLSHAFMLGFVTGETFPADYDADAAVWRVFNAVALDRLTSWRALEPTRGEALHAEPVDEALAAARRAGLQVRWGSLLSAGTFDLPEWAVSLRGKPLYDAALAHVDTVITRYGVRLSDVDLVEQTLDHERYTPAMLRLLGMRITAEMPHARVRARFDGALDGPRVFDVLRAADALTGQRIGLDAVTVDQVFGPRPIDAQVLGAVLLRLTQFGRPLLVGRLEVGGGSPLETTLNLETVVRVLFADPLVQGIYFAGLRAEHLAEPSAALLDDAGQPTGAGRTLDDLFRKTWWNDETLTTSELGEADTRLFLGRHRVTATLRDGSSVEVELDLSRQRDGDDETVILQPVAKDR